MRQNALDYMCSPPYLPNVTPVSAYSGKYEFPQLRGDSQVSFTLNNSHSKHHHRDQSSYRLGEESTHTNASNTSTTTTSNESTNSNSSSVTNTTTIPTTDATSHHVSMESMCEIKV